jgi:hypothetical protein
LLVQRRGGLSGRTTLADRRSLRPITKQNERTNRQRANTNVDEQSAEMRGRAIDMRRRMCEELTIWSLQPLHSSSISCLQTTPLPPLPPPQRRRMRCPMLLCPCFL